MTRLRIVSLLATCLLATPLLAEDWPGWLGPRRDGTSTAKVKPWKGDLEVVWKKGVGEGHSSPVVVGGKVYLFTKVADEEAEAVTAYEAKTGKPLWTKSYPRTKFKSLFGAGPQSTPMVSGGKLYSYGATGILTCFDAANGKQLWQDDTLKEFSPPPLTFGTACSPLIDGENVYLNVGAKGASVVAFNKDDGKVAWKSLDDRASYSSGIQVGNGARRQVVFLTQQGLKGLAAKDGKKLWDYKLVDKLNESSTTPVHVGKKLLASSVTFGMVALELEPGDKGETVKEVWKNPALTCYFSTPMPVGKEHVYVVAGKLSFTPSSTLYCVELATGKIAWKRDNVGKYHAALMRTGDDKLLMLSDKGELVLIDPDPKGYKELARSKFENSHQIWAHPAVSGGLLYYRDERDLYCLRLPE
jgi:outer membrane protein assembly factor BamB